MTRIVHYTAAALFLAAVAVSAAAGRTPRAVLYVYAILSLLTFAWYGRDKYAARTGNRRTPEKTLHLLALLGGWPGALAAQQLFRHKTRKKPFRLLFWATVLLNCGAVVFLHSPAGAAYLRALSGP